MTAHTVSPPVDSSTLPAKAGAFYSQAVTLDDLLRSQHGTVSMRAIARQAGVSHETVRRRAKQLGFDTSIRVGRGAPAWSAADLAYLTANYPTQPIYSIADALGRSVRSIRERAKKLRLRRADRPTKKRATPLSDPPDNGRRVMVRPPLGPGYGPRTIHRISA